MDLQELKIKYPLLISYMEAKNYSQQYIRHVKNEIHWILNESGNCHWKTYDDIYQTYVRKYTNKNTLNYKRKMLLVIKLFALESVMPDGSIHAHRVSYYDGLCVEFRHFIDTYRNVIKAKYIKPFHYHKSYECSACSFLSRLQKQGVYSLEHITEKNVTEVFISDDKLCQSYHFKNDTAFVFKICAPFYQSGICSKVLSYLPAIRNKRRNVQYLTKEEVTKIKSVLDDDSSLSLQNKAIGLLAFYTGLRSCDIAGLTLDQIDWENDLIRVIQQKTGALLILPLRAIVGNAIFEYITKERPQSSENTVFLTTSTPYKKLSPFNLYQSCTIIMKKANIRSRPGDRKGFHLFRHHLATSLLEKEVEHPVISQTLGHRSPESLDTYLAVDFIHLKKCALSINCFPVKEEVFQ
jgi:site-specific recombinase XerD